MRASESEFKIKAWGRSPKPLSVQFDAIEKSCGTKMYGTPSRIRTCDLLIRSQLLYPAELPGPTSDGEKDVPSRLSDWICILMVRAEVQYLPISPNATEGPKSSDNVYGFIAFYRFGHAPSIDPAEHATNIDDVTW